MDSGFVDGHPSGEFLEPALGSQLERAVRQRADIERDRATVVGVVDEGVEQLVETTPLEVQTVVTPCVVHGAGCFPRNLGCVLRVGKLVVAHGDEIGTRGVVRGDPSVDHTFGCLLADELDELIATCGGHLFLGSLTPRVEPEHVRMVALDEFSDLGQAFLVPVFFEIPVGRLLEWRVVLDLGPRRQRAARMFPVLPVRVVEAEFDPILATGRGKFAQRIASAFSEGRGSDVVVGDRRIPKGEPVMVLAGDDEVTHAGVGRRADPCISIKLRWIELCQQLVIVLLGNTAALRPAPLRADPLSIVVAAHFLSLPNASWNRVEPEVDEHPKARLTHPVPLGVLDGLRSEWIDAVGCSGGDGGVSCHGHCQDVLKGYLEGHGWKVSLLIGLRPRGAFRGIKFCKIAIRRQR